MNEAQMKAERVKREFPETEAAFATVRQAMIERIIGSKNHEAPTRENLYHGIQVLDAVLTCMRQARDAGAIEDYADTIRKGNAPGL